MQFWQRFSVCAHRTSVASFAVKKICNWPDLRPQSVKYYVAPVSLRHFSLFPTRRSVMSVDDAVDVYRRVTSYPTVKSGRISMEEAPGHLQVYSEWSQRCLERSESVKIGRGHLVQHDVVIPTPAHQLYNEIWNCESASGKYRAIVRNIKDKKGDEKQWVEIWSDTRNIRTIDVQAADQHGKIYENDGAFGTLQWSNAESHILYIAEKKVPKSKSYFDASSNGKSDKTTDEPRRGDEFLYRESWGEQLYEKHHPVLCVLDIETGGISVLENLPDDVSPGQAIWCPDDLGIICVGWWHRPYRLGFVYCTQRRSALFHINLKTFTCTTIGPTDRAVRSPVFSPDLKKLVYLDEQAGGPHRNCSRLVMCDWATKGIVPVVDIVGSVGSEGDFPGIFVDKLESNCWADDSQRVLLNTQWRSRTELIVVHVELGHVTRLTADPAVGSWSLLDVRKDVVLAACSSPSQPQYLVIGKLPSTGKETEISWMKLDTEPSPFLQINWKVEPVQVPEPRINPDFKSLDYEYILMEPEREAGTPLPPLMVYIHGGPHSVFATEFDSYRAGFCLLGYVVLAVNYRGSTGFGQDSILSIPGHIGRQDVDDVQSVVEQIAASGLVDKEKVVVIGGSHGGFLTAHVIGQFPELYRAAVARNPVINIASMVEITDIRDWCYVESGLPFDFKSETYDHYATMLSKSPIVNVDRIKAPLLLMLGGKDARVPTSQGLALHKEMRARGKAIKLYWYPDCGHPITDVKSEADAFVNIAKWFAEGLDKTNVPTSC